MPGIWLAAPADHEALDDRVRLIDLRLRNHRLPEATGGLRNERERHDRHMREVLARRVVVDVEERLEPPRRREHRHCRLHVDADVA